MPAPKRNVDLAAAVARDGRHKYAIAAAAGVNATDFGGYISGRVQPTPAVARRIADALGLNVRELFPHVS